MLVKLSYRIGLPFVFIYTHISLHRFGSRLSLDGHKDSLVIHVSWASKLTQPKVDHTCFNLASRRCSISEHGQDESGYPLRPPTALSVAAPLSLSRVGSYKVVVDAVGRSCFSTHRVPAQLSLPSARGRQDYARAVSVDSSRSFIHILFLELKAFRLHHSIAFLRLLLHLPPSVFIGHLLSSPE